MKKIFLRWIAFVAFFIAAFIQPHVAQAQYPKSFSDNPQVWFKEMKEFLSASNKDEARPLMDKFEPVWLQSRLTTDQQKLVISMTNDMLKKRMNAFPDFRNYVIAIMGYTNSSQTADAFAKWHQSLEKLVTGKTKRFSDYMELSSGLFTSNILYESSSTKWQSATGNYVFEYDSMPRIIFPESNLMCYSKNDSSVIYNVKGIYYPLRKEFIGTGGKVYWTRAGFPTTETYAELRQTTIDLTGSDFTSDSILFYNKKYFKTPLVGRLTDKILANVTPETATYPRFDSYNLMLEIRELIKDADYRGGFSMHGSKMIGAGSKAQKATLTFKRNNKPFLIASSRSFAVKPDRINADNAGVVIYFDKDSLFHPGLHLKYIYKDRLLSLVRNTESGIQMPFTNTFHEMDIMVDGIYWRIDDPVMELKMISGAGEGKMLIESTKLYTDQRYEKVQGMSDVNPLFTLKQYVERSGRIIYVPDFAKYLKTSESNARSLIFFLAEKGFLNYDADMDEAVLNDKLYYYLAARSNKTDYDKLEISSVIDAKPNAKLNLLNFDLDMQGVSRIVLSDSQNVFVVPDNQEMKIKKNRDFEFSGRVHAGKTDFFGKQFAFNYEKFLFDLEVIDSIRLKVESGELDDNGRPKLIPLRNTLQNVSGTLYIDSMTNKSARINYPKYPYFVSDKESYVYYDDPSVYNGVYARDKFYFKMDPFTIDSLDNFTASSLVFDGDFNSAGIFPVIREKVVVRPDFSFGFERNTPPEGYTAYGGKGRFTEKLDLSFQGLLGAGKLDYLSSASTGDFVFFPDSTASDKAQFELRKEIVATTAYPQASGKDVRINWQPYKDRMYIYKTTDNLELYDKNVALNGNLLLAKKGLGGDGRAFYAASELISRDFGFKQEAYGADTADFNLKSDDQSIMAISTKNVKAKIDFVNRMGEFTSNGKGSYVSFPLNQYICFIAQFKWFMDNKEVEFTDDASSTKLNIHGSDFVSVNPFQDSLRWTAGVARYSLVDYLIKAKKVKEILVADASIQPEDSSTIVIEKNAVMRPLVNAVIVANTSTKHHTMIEADVNITGRKSYTGRGKYAYTDQAGTKHLVELERISVDTSFQTYASGVIAETNNFQLNTNIQYKGKVNIIASNPLVNFDGFARVNHGCTDQLKVDWFSFNGDIDPKGVNIPVNDPRNETRTPLAVSVSLTADSSGFYSSFFTPKRGTSDADVIKAEGFLAFDQKNNVYKIASVEKIVNPDHPGDMIQLDNKKCIVTGEGKLDLATNFGQFKTTTIGTVVNNLNNDSTEFDLLMGLDFMFNEDALKSIVEVIENFPTLQATNDGRPVWIRGMKMLLGTEAADKLTTEFNLYGAPKKVPQQLQQSLFLTNVKLRWDKASQAYKSRGPIGIGFIGKSSVSRMLMGHIEVQRRRNNDVFSLYLEADKNNWWYFTYSRGIMQAISSDTKFNETIQNMKPEKRIAPTKDGAQPYEYMLSTDRKKAEFVRKMKGE